MATRSSTLTVFPADGGWVSYFDDAVIPANSWDNVDNGEYINGGRTIRVRDGISRYNTTARTLADASTGQCYAIKDFHRYTIASSVLTDTQKHVAVFLSATSGGIFKDDLDGTWDTLLDPWTSATTSFPPSITLADGFACFFNGRSTPQKWDGTTLSDLGTSAPVGTGAAWHLRRLFVVGEASGDGSTVDYCAASDVTDWTGGDAGSLPPFNENDGDYVTGVSQPLNGKIYFFKGPNTGSIHELSGNTPSTWTTRQVGLAPPCLQHRSVVTTNSDVYWASRNGFHSLQRLQATGNSRISGPIESMVELVYSSAITSTIYGFHDPYRRAIVWMGGSTSAFVYWYELDKWSRWLFEGHGAETFKCGTSALSSGTYRDLIGGTSGIVYDLGGSYRDVNSAGTAQNLVLTLDTPTIYSFPGIPPTQEKVLRRLTLFGRPAFDGATETAQDVTTTVYTENGSQSSITMTLPTSVSKKNGTCYIDAPVEERSRWFKVTFQVTQASGTTQFPEISGYAITVDPGEDISYEAA